MLEKLLGHLGFVRLAYLESVERHVEVLEYELDRARARLAQMERAFAYQGMAFSRRYEALERTVLDAAARQPMPPFIIKKDAK